MSNEPTIIGGPAKCNPPGDPVKEGRVAIIRLGRRDIQNLLGIWLSPILPRRIDVLRTKLPDDAIIVSVHAEWETNSICVMIASADFPVVQEGARVPPIGARMTMRRIVDLVPIAETQ